MTAPGLDRGALRELVSQARGMADERRHLPLAHARDGLNRAADVIESLTSENAELAQTLSGLLARATVCHRDQEDGMLLDCEACAPWIALAADVLEAHRSGVSGV